MTMRVKFGEGGSASDSMSCLEVLVSGIEEKVEEKEGVMDEEKRISPCL